MAPGRSYRLSGAFLYHRRSTIHSPVPGCVLYPEPFEGLREPLRASQSILVKLNPPNNIYSCGRTSGVRNLPPQKTWGGSAECDTYFRPMLRLMAWVIYREGSLRAGWGAIWERKRGTVITSRGNSYKGIKPVF